MITTFHNIHQLLLQITFAPLSRLCSAIHPLKTPQVGYSILHPHFSCLQCVLWVLNSPGSFFNFPEFQVTVSNNFLEASSLFTRSLHLRRLLTFIVIFKIRYYIAVQYPPFFFPKDIVLPLNILLSTWAGADKSSLSSLDRVQKRLCILVGEEVFSTLQPLLQAGRGEPFTTLLLLPWKVFGQTTILSSARFNLHD